MNESASDSPFCPPEVPLPGPAFPSPKQEIVSPLVEVPGEGPESITPRMYAAIHLRVADSGAGWLDDMIRRSRELDQLR